MQAGATIDADELPAFLPSGWPASRSRPIVVSTTEQLPRNASGKILKRDLRDGMVDD